MIIYEVAGKPVPWAASRMGANGAYNPKNVSKQRTIWQLKPQVNHPPFSCPCNLHVTFYMPIPKGTSGIRRRQMLAGIILPIGKPDRTNLLKFVEDCLEEAGVFTNDSVVVGGEVRKLYGETPKTLIRVETLRTEASNQ